MTYPLEDSFSGLSADSGCLYVFSHMPQVSAYEFRYILKCYIMHHYQKTPDHPYFLLHSPRREHASGPKILSLANLC